MCHDHLSAVAGFYDTHPINEDEILKKIEARGSDPEQLTENHLKNFVMSASAEPWERALAHAVAANVAAAAKQSSQHAEHYREAVQQVAALPDADERSILEATLRMLPVPG